MTDRSGSRPTVLHLLAQFDFGGAEKHMAYIWSQAGHLRHRHVFAAIGQGGRVGQQMIGDGAEVTCLGADPAIPRLGTIRAVTRFLRRTRPDAIHGHGPEPTFYGLLGGRLAGVPVRIGEEFALPTYSDRAAFVFRQLYRTAHAVYCNCEAVRAAVIARRIAPRGKTFVLLNPMRVASEPLPLERDPAHLTLVFVGRLVPHKNPGILLPVLRQLRAEGIPARLWLVGDGPDRARLEAEAAARGVAEHVTFWGYRGDVEELLRRADVFVHTSTNDGSSLAVGEAMGCRLPVVSTDVGGPAEMLDDGESGFLVPPCQEAPLVEALRALWQMGPRGRQAMGERARAAVIERCDPGRYVARLEGFYDDLLAAGGR
jgi:glycosyltransferase involved in cell wall biosynthesis